MDGTVERQEAKWLLKYRKSIMGVAALLIFISHEWEPILGAYAGIGFIEYFVKRTSFVGVDFFFFLSGIGLVYAIQKHKLSVFYVRRLKRVYIPFFFTALAMMIVNGLGWDVFLKNVSGYNFLFTNIYSLLWFVPGVIILYFIFPFYYKLFVKASNKYQFTALVLLIWLFLSLGLEGTIREDMYGFTNRVPVFVIGILTGWMIQEEELVFTKLTWLLCITTFLLGIYFAYKTNFQGYYLVVPTSNCCIPNLLIVTSGSWLLAKGFWVMEQYGKVLGRWSLKFIEFFGTISLEFYCVQEWIGTQILVQLRGHHRIITINAAIFIGVLVAALLLYGICRLIDLGLKKWIC